MSNIKNPVSALNELLRSVSFTPLGEETYLDDCSIIINLIPVQNAGCVMIQIKSGSIYFTLSGKDPDTTSFEIKAGTPFIIPLSLESDNTIKLIQKDINTKIVYLWGI